MVHPEIRVGLAGCGSIGLVHLNTLVRMPEAQVTAIADLDPQRRNQALKLAPGSIGVADSKELIEMPEIDAILICLPTPFHASVANAAFHQKKHVYLEKPGALNTEEARTVIDSWRQSGCIAQIGFNYRFHPMYRKARRMMRSSQPEKFDSVRSVFTTANRDLTSWRADAKSSGGTLFELGSHHVDLLRFLFDCEITEVQSAKLPSGHSEDDVSVEMILQNKILVRSFFSIGSKNEDYFEIQGKSRKLRLNRHDPGLFNLPPLLYLKKRIHSGYEPSYELALRNFVSCVRKKQAAVPDLTDGIHTLAVLEAIQESRRSGGAVRVMLSENRF